MDERERESLLDSAANLAALTGIEEKLSEIKDLMRVQALALIALSNNVIPRDERRDVIDWNEALDEHEAMRLKRLLLSK